MPWILQATFLDVSKVKPLLGLTKTLALVSEFEVARNILRTQMQEFSIVFIESKFPKATMLH